MQAIKIRQASHDRGNTTTGFLYRMAGMPELFSATGYQPAGDLLFINNIYVNYQYYELLFINERT